MGRRWLAARRGGPGRAGRREGAGERYKKPRSSRNPRAGSAPAIRGLPGRPRQLRRRPLPRTGSAAETGPGTRAPGDGVAAAAPGSSPRARKAGSLRHGHPQQVPRRRDEPPPRHQPAPQDVQLQERVPAGGEHRAQAAGERLLLEHGDGRRGQPAAERRAGRHLPHQGQLGPAALLHPQRQDGVGHQEPAHPVRGRQLLPAERPSQQPARAPLRLRAQAGASLHAARALRRPRAAGGGPAPQAHLLHLLGRREDPPGAEPPALLQRLHPAAPLPQDRQRAPGLLREDDSAAGSHQGVPGPVRCPPLRGRRSEVTGYKHKSRGRARRPTGAGTRRARRASPSGKEGRGTGASRRGPGAVAGTARHLGAGGDPPRKRHPLSAGKEAAPVGLWMLQGAQRRGRPVGKAPAGSGSRDGTAARGDVCPGSRIPPPRRDHARGVLASPPFCRGERKALESSECLITSPRF